MTDQKSSKSATFITLNSNLPTAGISGFNDQKVEIPEQIQDDLIQDFFGQPQCSF